MNEANQIRAEISTAARQANLDQAATADAIRRSLSFWCNGRSVAEAVDFGQTYCRCAADQGRVAS
jgi:hypothetical protein